MDTRDIVAKFLRENGFDGLCGDGCGCGIDDLASCSSESFLECTPAHKYKMDCENCDSACDLDETTGYCYRETEPGTDGAAQIKEPALETHNKAINLDQGAFATLQAKAADYHKDPLVGLQSENAV
jgi:hypothetical protein